MSELGLWLREQLDSRGLTQTEAAVYAGVGQATISDILSKGHIPKVETLFRLADYFDTSREQVLRAAGHLPPLSETEEAAVEEAMAAGDDETLVRALLREFRRLPDAWKPVAVEQVSVFRRLAESGPARIIGEEPFAETGTLDEEEPDAEEVSRDRAAQAA
jgi:transcriptional regulator with XRE-family HTH domain